MKKILVVTTFNNHFRFFNRLAETLKEFDYETHFVTNKKSIISEAARLNIEVYGFKKGKKARVEVDVENSFEVAARFLDTNSAINIAQSIWHNLEELHSLNKYEYLFIWGGVRLIELTASKYAQENNIKTIFFELGNFPHKIFVDPHGTNARSLLANKTDVLNKLNYDLASYREWSKHYLESSLKNHAVPQSSSASGIEYSKNIEDLIGYNFEGLIQTEPIITKEKLTGKYLRKLVKLKYDKIDLRNTNYIFLPMQVNKDAQLILNSDVGNLDALKITNEKAIKNGLKLLVKPHPGEVEFGFIKKVNQLKEKLGFAFVNNNTIELITNAQEVMTINSTVGLQAKLFEKKVTCIGKAFYSDFNEENLAAYIQEYLIDADFWNDVPISIDSAAKIVKRSELN